MVYTAYKKQRTLYLHVWGKRCKAPTIDRMLCEEGLPCSIVGIPKLLKKFERADEDFRAASGIRTTFQGHRWVSFSFWCSVMTFYSHMYTVHENHTCFCTVLSCATTKPGGCVFTVLLLVFVPPFYRTTIVVMERNLNFLLAYTVYIVHV